MLQWFKNGQGSVVLRVKLRDSSVTTGAGKTGLGIASAGLIISTVADNEATATVYTAAGSTIETITTLGTFAAPTATKCRFKELDATNHPGVYEIQIADARFAVSSAKSLLVSVKATGVVETDAVIVLTSMDPYDGVRANLTALPNAAAAAANGLLTAGTGTNQLSAASGIVQADVAKFGGTALTATGGRPEVNMTHAAGSAITSSGGIPSVNVAQWKTTAPSNLDGSNNVQVAVASVATGAITAAAIAADAIGASELASDAVAEIVAGVRAMSVDTVGSITLQQAVSIVLAAVAGVTSSGGAVLKTPDGSTTRITATIDGSNNRTGMVLTPSS